MDVVCQPTITSVESDSGAPHRGPARLHDLALSKLPIGAVEPQGWIRHQLELMASGMVGRLAEISTFLKPDNGWFDRDQYGWEEQPYWLRGFYRLAILTKRDDLLVKAKRWVDAVLGSQDSDGYFGPRGLKSVVLGNGREIVDLWAHMVMIDVLFVHHEYTADERVPGFLTRFFRFCESIPEERFVPAPESVGDLGKSQIAGKRYIDIINEQLGKGSSRWFVQWPRSGEMIPHLYRLHELTGEAWLLGLARRFYDHIMPPLGEWLHDHVVNFTQRFRYPGAYYRQSGDRWHLEQTEYWYRQHMDTWGQQPRGAFAADERIRPGYVDPRQAIETCAITEFAKSFAILGRMHGDPVFADRTEDIMLNHFPAATTADHTGVRYLTASNMPASDATFDHDYYNDRHYGGALRTSQIAYSATSHRCCQHNHGQGWPEYAENLWQSSHDHGLVAWMYAASRVVAPAGVDAVSVSILEETDYPFDDTIRLTMHPDRPVVFPLYLRVPRWCATAAVSVNGEPVAIAAGPGSYIRIEREWRPDDRVELVLPMDVRVHRWPRNGSVTVNRGPLSYSVRIEEEWKRCGGTDEWPDWEVLPLSPWNYGLCVSTEDPGRDVRVTVRTDIDHQPWTVAAAPVEIRVRARIIPDWIIENGMVQEVPERPVRSNEPEQEITLIPMGCARLRVTCLPIVGDHT